MAGLFNSFNPFQRHQGQLARGALIAFSYPYSHAIIPNVIHDPYPLLIVSSIYDKFVCGVNLHYLTFPYIKKILMANKQQLFSYTYNVKPDKYLGGAYRTYYRIGMSQIKIMDMDFLLQVLGVVKSFDLSQLDFIKKQIRDQIRERLQLKASELTKSQKEQARLKSIQMQKTLQGGVMRDIVKPEPDIVNQ